MTHAHDRKEDIIMPALQLINTDPLVTLVPSIDSCGNLELSYEGAALSRHEDSLHVANESLPVDIEILDFEDQNGDDWTVTVVHEDEDDVPHAWECQADPAGCQHSWSETNQFHEVTVTATNGSAPAKKKLVFIEVKPYPYQPDPT